MDRNLYLITRSAWQSMKDRCDNKKHPRYHRYGGRGITYQESWKEFSNFLADLKEKPHKNLSLDRVDNNLGYTKDNCRWATHYQQAFNRCSTIPQEDINDALALSYVKHPSGLEMTDREIALLLDLPVKQVSYIIRKYRTE